MPYISGGAGTGGIATLTAADTSVVVAGTSTAKTVRTNTLDVIAADQAPAADWSNNSHKITGLAAATAAGNALRYEQLPTVTDGTTTISSGLTQLDFVSGAVLTDGGGGVAQLALCSGAVGLMAGLGLKAIAFDPRSATTTQLQASQQVIGSAVGLSQGVTITNVGVYVAVVGSGLTISRVGIYNSAFSLVASSTNDTTFGTATGYQLKALTTPYLVPSTGIYYLAYIGVGTTPITTERAQPQATGMLGPMANGAYFGWFQTSQANFPSTATPSAGTPGAGLLFAS